MLRRSGVFIVAAASTGAAVQYATDEGTRRSVKFWGVAFPIFLHYRFTQWQMKDQSPAVAHAAFNLLHDKYAPVAEKVTLEMRGFHLKNAQLVSTLDDFLPPQYMKWAKKMQGEVPAHISPAEARKMIAEKLGRPLEDMFSSFDDTPIGCASIGQVHLL